MTKIDRREFIRSTAFMAAVPAFVPAIERRTLWRPEKMPKNIVLGLICSANNPEEDLKAVRDLGFRACQLYIDSYSLQLANRLSGSLNTYNLQPVSLICMGPGIYRWDLNDGPSTIGLVPRENRPARVRRLHEGIDFCQAAGIPAVHAHFGFIPENPKDILYTEFIETMKPVGEYARNHGIDVYFETGQETPVTLLRAIQDIGTGNLYINYDPANLVMYGKANPVDGLKVVGKYVRAVHAKDGLYPTNPHELGREVPVPTGEVDFPALLASLKKLDFRGSIIIERELAGSRSEDILKTKEYLERLISEIYKE
jgi:L-ribulose-5-phosphate 3-epimerase